MWSEVVFRLRDPESPWRRACIVTGGILLAVLLCCGIGYLVSPRAGGEPLVLRPDLRKALEFEHAEAVLYDRLADVREDVRFALDGRRELLERSNRLEGALQVVMDVHAEAERLDPPLAYRARRQALLDAAQAHGDLVRRAAEWLNEPSPENFRSVQEALCALDGAAPECAALTSTPEPSTPTP
jgi:hypothetical protein